MAITPRGGLCLATLLAGLCYVTTLQVPFYFDDTIYILENPRITSGTALTDLAGSRYVGLVSFALNYDLGGFSPIGFHLVNIAIHLINGLLVYHLVRLLLKAMRSTAPVAPVPLPDQVPSWIAVSVATVFLLHPIQTQAVTYITQRFASLATLFYLSAVSGYLVWRMAPPGARHRTLWYGMAWLATVLAMKTKEISFTLPLMLVAIETICWRPVARRQWIALVPFLLTFAIIPLSRLDVAGTGVGLARETAEIGRDTYLLTEFGVVVTYVRLLLLPVHQNLDYDIPLAGSFFEPAVLLSFLLLFTLGSIALCLVFSRSRVAPSCRLAGFGLIWFFLTLSVESSIIPIADVLFEHRLYLPSVGFFLALVTGLVASQEALKTTVAGRPDGIIARLAWRSRLSHLSHHVCLIAGLVPIVLVLAWATYHRNTVWQNPVALWSTVVAQSPGKARPHLSLGYAYKAEGRYEDAIREYRAALALRPAYAEAYSNLGNAYLAQGRLDEAIEAHEEAVRLRPDLARAHHNLGNAYVMRTRMEDAKDAYQAALLLEPDNAEAHNNLGNIALAQDRLDVAGSEYLAAIGLRPGLVEAHHNLGIVYQQQGRADKAQTEWALARQLTGPPSSARSSLMGR